jgi:hypothetical protein
MENQKQILLVQFQETSQSITLISESRHSYPKTPGNPMPNRLYCHPISPLASAS